MFSVQRLFLSFLSCILSYANLKERETSHCWTTAYCTARSCYVCWKPGCLFSTGFKRISPIQTVWILKSHVTDQLMENQCHKQVLLENVLCMCQLLNMFVWNEACKRKIHLCKYVLCWHVLVNYVICTSEFSHLTEWRSIVSLVAICSLTTRGFQIPHIASLSCI